MVSETSKMSVKSSTKQNDPKEHTSKKSNEQFTTGNTPNVSEKNSRAAEPVQEKSSLKTKKVSTTGKCNSSRSLVIPSDQIKLGKSSKEDQAKGETIEELQLIQKSLYVGLFKKYYYIKHQSNDEPPVDDRKFYSLLKAKDYISEGANFLLHRYLARTIYIGSFELSTMYINGDMCRNIYVCKS